MSSDGIPFNSADVDLAAWVVNGTFVGVPEMVFVEIEICVGRFLVVLTGVAAFFCTCRVWPNYLLIVWL